MSYSPVLSSKQMRQNSETRCAWASYSRFQRLYAGDRVNEVVEGGIVGSAAAAAILIFDLAFRNPSRNGLFLAY